MQLSQSNADRNQIGRFVPKWGGLKSAEGIQSLFVNVYKHGAGKPRQLTCEDD